MCATWQPLSDRPVNNSKSQPAIRHHSLVNDLFIAIVGSTLFANAKSQITNNYMAQLTSYNTSFIKRLLLLEIYDNSDSLSHETAVPDHVHSQYGSEPALHMILPRQPQSSRDARVDLLGVRLTLIFGIPCPIA